MKSILNVISFASALAISLIKLNVLSGLSINEKFSSDILLFIFLYFYSLD